MNLNAQNVRFLTANLPNQRTTPHAMQLAALSYQYYRQRCAVVQHRCEYTATLF